MCRINVEHRFCFRGLFEYSNGIWNRGKTGFQPSNIYSTFHWNFPLSIPLVGRKRKQVKINELSYVLKNLLRSLAVHRICCRNIVARTNDEICLKFSSKYRILAVISASNRITLIYHNRTTWIERIIYMTISIGVLSRMRTSHPVMGMLTFVWNKSLYRNLWSKSIQRPI